MGGGGSGHRGPSAKSLKEATFQVSHNDVFLQGLDEGKGKEHTGALEIRGKWFEPMGVAPFPN